MISKRMLGVAIGIALVTTMAQTWIPQSADGRFDLASADDRKAPPAISGENVYIAWWTNKTDNNEEVIFRASTDGGATFGDKINLSNTTNANSWRVETAGEGDSVIVTWWETNQTSDTPVARISTDAGQTFGPMLMLATNGTLGGAAEEETEEGEGE